MRRRILIGTGVLIVLGTVVLVPLLAGGKPARQVVLVAREMSFRLPGQATENPVVHVGRGETIQLILQNDDEGIDHDLSVPEWGVRVDGLAGGTRGVINVRVPDKPGRVEYVCTRHGVMMKGIIEIGD
jgi:hypothetical protein